MSSRCRAPSAPMPRGAVRGSERAPRPSSPHPRWPRPAVCAASSRCGAVGVRATTSRRWSHVVRGRCTESMRGDTELWSALRSVRPHRRVPHAPIAGRLSRASLYWHPPLPHCRLYGNAICGSAAARARSSEEVVIVIYSALLSTVVGAGGGSMHEAAPAVESQPGAIQQYAKRWSKAERRSVEAHGARWSVGNWLDGV